MGSDLVAPPLRAGIASAARGTGTGGIAVVPARLPSREPLLGAAYHAEVHVPAAPGRT